MKTRNIYIYLLTMFLPVINIRANDLCIYLPIISVTTCAVSGTSMLLAYCINAHYMKYNNSNVSNSAETALLLDQDKRLGNYYTCVNCSFYSGIIGMLIGIGQVIISRIAC